MYQVLLCWSDVDPTDLDKFLEQNPILEPELSILVIRPQKGDSLKMETLAEYSHEGCLEIPEEMLVYPGKIPLHSLVKKREEYYLTNLVTLINTLINKKEVELNYFMIEIDHEKIIFQKNLEYFLNLFEILVSSCLLRKKILTSGFEEMEIIKFSPAFGPTIPFLTDLDPSILIYTLYQGTIILRKKMKQLRAIFPEKVFYWDTLNNLAEFLYQRLPPKRGRGRGVSATYKSLKKWAEKMIKFGLIQKQPYGNDSYKMKYSITEKGFFFAKLLFNHQIMKNFVTDIKEPMQEIKSFLQKEVKVFHR